MIDSGNGGRNPWTLALAASALSPLLSASDGLVVNEELVLSGETAPGGQVTLEVHADPGEFARLVFSPGFLETPLSVGGRPLFVDVTLPWFLLDLGVVPATGTLSITSPIPNDASLLGVRITMQAAAPKLSNATTLAMHSPSTTVAPTPALTGFGGQLFVADLNGDGRDDIVTSALGAAGGAGEVHIAFGPGTTPSLVLSDPTPQSGGQFGAGLAAVDLVGSSDVDLLIGAFGAGPGGLADSTGEVWIFEGPTFTSATPLTSPTPEIAAGFGLQIRTGDFDGNGSVDIAVGEPGATVGGSARAGRVHVFDGATLGHTLTLEKPLVGDTAAEAQFGFALASGDIDGDGKDDLAVGAPAAVVSGLVQVGEAWVYSGPLVAPPTRVLDIHAGGSSAFACRLELADIVGDARLDLIVGVPGGTGTPTGFNPTSIRVGEAAIYDGADPLAGIAFDDPTPEDLGHFGFEIQTADVDGNGALDLIVGANLATIQGLTHAGAVFVYLGPGLVERIELTEGVPTAGAQLGTFVFGADLDGNGVDSLIATAPTDAGPGGTGTGSIVVWDL